MIRFLFPEKVKESKKVIGIDGFLRKKQLQIGLNESDVITFQPNAAIVLDFGKEIRGGIRILTFDTQDAKCARIPVSDSANRFRSAMRNWGRKMQRTTIHPAIWKRICPLGPIYALAIRDFGLSGSICCRKGGSI